VSSYQGEIDWNILAGQNIKFAFIKATEGSGFVDKNFKTNYENANKSGVFAGAYHFFSYDSDGEAQADNFIKNVPISPNTLPPAIDIEFYGDNIKNPLSKEHTSAILKPLLEKLYKYYNKKPIIYATIKSYNLYINGDYYDYPIWIRSVNTRPFMSDGRKWLFWQYSDNKVLDGYTGDEEHIDMNVFNGPLEALESYAAE
jgi:lysozyme